MKLRNGKTISRKPMGKHVVLTPAQPLTEQHYADLEKKYADLQKRYDEMDVQFRKLMIESASHERGHKLVVGAYHKLLSENALLIKENDEMKEELENIEHNRMYQ